MTAGVLQSPLKTNISPIFLAEIFLLNIPQPNLICFRLTPRLDTEIGNRLSWRFSQQFDDIMVIFKDGNFWVLAKPDQPMPTIAMLIIVMMVAFILLFLHVYFGEKLLAK